MALNLKQAMIIIRIKQIIADAQNKTVRIAADLLWLTQFKGWDDSCSNT